MEPSAMDSWSLTLLGGFELRPASGTPADLPGQKDRALLAFLAMAPGSAHSRERLAGLLWSEHGDRQARDSLKQSLMRLRRCLGDADDGLLRADRQSIALERAAANVDVLDFERLVRAGTMEALAEATALYRGDLLEGLGVRDPAFEDWLLVERQRLRQLFERALTDLMTQALAAGEREKATEAARRLVLVDPLSEAAYRTLMQIHADQNQTAQALKLYETLRERLYRDMGVQPEPATTALHDCIRRRRTPAAPAETPAPAQDASPAAAKPSIAVLPFVNLSGDPEQQYFSDGVTEDIITELSRFRTLFVIARNSSFQYRGGDRDIVRIGRELGVRYIAEGSVRRIGERVRISAQLIEAASGSHLWAENFDRDAADILTVQDNIVRAIATTLGYRVEAAGRERALRLSPEALSAYDLMLRSEALFLRHAKEDNAEARRLAEQAVALDPKSALALTQLGWTHCLDHIFGWVEESEETLGTALALAQRAVLLDDADCRARWLLGHIHIFRREFDEARAHLRTAIALNPNDVEARGVYGIYLYAVGETEAALEQFDIAKRHNPFEFNWIIMCRGIALFTARRYDEALAALKQVHNPNNEVRMWLAASYAGAGCLPEARATLAEFLAIAEREMVRFPGRTLADWQPHLRHFVEYRDLREFDHLSAALRAAGLN
jgi:TolB-like protein/Flp pilus assembly protein TadD